MTFILDRLRAMPVATAWRHAKSIAVAIGLMWGTLWYFGGELVTAKADEALVEMLARQGMSPEDFRAMQQQLKDMDIDINAIRAGTNHVNEELDNLKDQAARVETKSNQTYDLLKTMIPMMRSEVRP